MILGNEELREYLSGLVQNNRLHHCMLFEGPQGVGKHYTAKWLAKVLSCKQPHNQPILFPCNECWSCKGVDEAQHPDHVFIGLDESKKIPMISIEQVRQLLRTVASEPRFSSQRVVIIDQARYLRQEAANALLKTLEEPSTSTIFVLIVPSARQLLPTIRSRAQRISFCPVESSELRQWLPQLLRERVAQESEELEFDSEQLLRLSDGCPGKLHHYINGGLDSWLSIRAALMDVLDMEVHQMFAWGKSHWQKLANNPLARSQWLSDALEIIEILLRDTLVYQATHSSHRLINSDLEERIQQWAEVLNAETVAKLQERISEARENQVINVSPRLALESIMLHIRGALEYGYAI